MQIKKFVIRFFLFTGILVLPLFFLEKKFDKSLFTSSMEKPIWILNKKNQKLDYAIGGSSRVENNADILTIDSVLGTNGLNMGYSGSDLAENYLTLYQFLKHGNILKNYILQVDDWSLIRPDSAFAYPFHEYFFLTFLDDPEVSRVIKNEEPPGKYALWKYVPFSKYAEFNTVYPVHKTFRSAHPIFDERKGTCLTDNKKLDTLALRKKLGPIRHVPHQKTLLYLDRISELCKKHGIRLIFYTAPVYAAYFQSLQNQACVDYIRTFCGNKDIRYFDFTKSRICREGDLMQNEAHLNISGTLLFSVMLADSLKPVLAK